MSELSAIGIDVSKKSLDVLLLFVDKEVHKTYENNSKGIKRLVKSLSKYLSNHAAFKIVLESTGKYHILAALMLTEAGFDVRVINPLLAKRYYGSQIRKVKTDKADAGVLAQIALLEKNLVKPFKADRKAIEINHKIALLASLENHLQALKAALANYMESQAVLKIKTSKTEKRIGRLVAKTKEAVKQLEDEIYNLILEKNVQSLEKLKSIPGISSTIAALLTHFMDTSCHHAKQWIAYLGMDISVRQSGSWRGRGKLTKRGNPYMRKRLYQAAWGAVFNYPEFKNYYDSLKSKGRSHVEALNIIARKLLRIAFAITKNNTIYDPKCIPEY